MASSTTNLDLISSSQASKEVTANALFDAESPAALYGRRASTTANLTWGYYGGYLSITGTPTAIANGTVALTNAATNYITAERSSGNVAASTSNTSWNDTANHARLYSVVTAGNLVTSYTDVRSFALGAAQNVATDIHTATEKTTPVDADEVGIWDSVSGLLNRVTWANIKATLKTYFDTLYPSVTTWYSSSWTPTITNGTNVASSTASSRSYFTRMDGRVTFNLYAEIDLTAAGEFSLTISLPVASNFNHVGNASGGGFSIVGAVGAISDNASARIIADITNDVLQINGYSAETGSRGWTFVGGYPIL